MNSTGYEKVAPPAYNQSAPNAPVPPDNAPPGTSYVVVQQTAPVPLGPHPATVTCPSCGARVTSKLEYEPGMKTHILCLVMCAVGLWLCCCIPYLTDSCKNTNHFCPNCNAYLGEYKR